MNTSYLVSLQFRADRRGYIKASLDTFKAEINREIFQVAHKHQIAFCFKATSLNICHLREIESWRSFFFFWNLFHVFAATLSSVLTRKSNFISSAMRSSLCTRNVHRPFSSSPLSRSHLFSLSPFLSSTSLSPPSAPPPPVTHSDSLCNMPSSKLNSTLLDLQPFFSRLNDSVLL